MVARIARSDPIRSPTGDRTCTRSQSPPALVLGQASPVASAERAWTIAFYGAGDNSCEESLIPDLESLRASFVPGQGVEVVVLLDRSPKYDDSAGPFGEDFADTRLFELTPAGFERIDGGKNLPGITRDSKFEADMGDPTVLRGFLREVKTRFPAQHYALIVYSHGNGRSLCPDQTDGGDELYPAEISAVLTAQESVDLIGLDVCSMGGIEVLYQWRATPQRFGANVIVGSASVSRPWPYTEIFSRLRAPGDGAPPGAIDPRTTTPEALGQFCLGRIRDRIDASYAARPARAYAESWACYDLRATGRVKDQFDRLARLLATAPGAKDALEDLRGSFGGKLAFNYAFEEDEAGFAQMPYFDLHELLTLVAADARFGADVREQAAAADAVVDEIVLDSSEMLPSIPFQPGRHGVYVVFPDGDRALGGARLWSKMRWYGPAVQEERADLYGGLAWCRDGATEGNGVVENWFELCDAWFDDTSAGAGGLNGYRP
jgi:clostripain